MFKPKTSIEKTALAVTRWVGSVQSIIVHTVVFVASFAAVWTGLLSFDRMLLVLTTVLSLEAIYLAIFIQMTVNRTTQSLEEVEQDIDEMQEDVDEIQEDIDEIQKDVDEIQEDVEEMSEEEKKEAVEADLENIKERLATLLHDIERLARKE